MFSAVGAVFAEHDISKNIIVMQALPGKELCKYRENGNRIADNRSLALVSINEQVITGFEACIVQNFRKMRNSRAVPL